jgi:hypothetical protein
LICRAYAALATFLVVISLRWRNQRTIHYGGGGGGGGGGGSSSSVIISFLRAQFWKHFPLLRDEAIFAQEIVNVHFRSKIQVGLPRLAADHTSVFFKSFQLDAITVVT